MTDILHGLLHLRINKYIWILHPSPKSGEDSRMEQLSLELDGSNILYWSNYSIRLSGFHDILPSGKRSDVANSFVYTLYQLLLITTPRIKWASH